MEKLKVKHDHKLTDILKVGIFAIFLLLPFLTFAPTGLYYGVNEYATNNTTTEVNINYKYETNEVSSIDDLVEGNIYHLSITNEFIDSALSNDDYFICYPLYIYNADFDNYQFTTDELLSINGTGNNYYELDFYGGDSSYIYCFVADNSFYSAVLGNLVDETFTFDAVIKLGEFEIVNQNFKDYISSSDFNIIESVEVQEDKSQTISQQMYNGWRTMWETPMYNWTNNSILKTGLDNFTNVFGVNNNSYITNLITYELIIVTIYIVVDIVLTLFKWLTHMVDSKE